MTVLAPRVAALLLFAAAAIALFTHASTLVVAREDGVLRRWRAAPLPPGVYFSAKIIATVLAAGLGQAILVLESESVARLHLTVHAVAAMLVIGTLGALSRSLLSGPPSQAFISTAQSAQPALMLTYLPLVFLSGAFGPAPGPAALADHGHQLPAGAADRGRHGSGRC